MTVVSFGEIRFVMVEPHILHERHEWEVQCSGLEQFGMKLIKPDWKRIYAKKGYEDVSLGKQFLFTKRHII